MTQAELQTLADAGSPLPAGDITLSQPLFVKGTVRSDGTTLHTNNIDALVALPDALRFFDPTPYFPGSGGYRTLGHSCIRYLNTPGDWIQNCDMMTISMRLTRFNNGGSIAGLAGNRPFGAGGDNFPASPWVLYTHNDWAGCISLHLKLATGAMHTLRWRLDNMGVEQLVVFTIQLATGTVLLSVDGVLTGMLNGVMPPAGSKLANNETSALFLGAVSNQAASKGEWGCCDCTIREPSITYGTVPAFLPLLTCPAYGLPIMAYNGGYGYLHPTNSTGERWAKGTNVSRIAFSGQRWGAAVTVQSALRTTVSDITVDKNAVGVQVLGGPLNNYPVNVTNYYGYKQYDCPVRLQNCGISVTRGIYAEYPVRSVFRADNCGMTTVRDVFQAPESDHTVEDCMRFDKCCHIDIGRSIFDYEDGIGPKNSYVRVVGSPFDTSPPPFLGFTHVAGSVKGIDLTGSPWKLPEYDGNGNEIPYPYYARLINTIMPVRYNV